MEARAARGLRLSHGNKKAPAVRDLGSALAAGLFPYPHLLPAQERDAARHAELAAALEQLELGLVVLAVLGIQHAPARPVPAAVRGQAPQGHHPLDRLAVVRPLALAANRIRAMADIEDLDHPAC